MKPKAKRGMRTIHSYENTGNNWTYTKKGERVDAFQRDIDLVKKIKRTNLTQGDQEYLIGALNRLANYEKDKYNWEN